MKSVLKEALKKQVKKALNLKEYQRIIVHRQLLSPFRMDPAYIIAGVQKGGTTSLHHYLSQHPQVASSYLKEAHFFNRAFEQGKSYYKAFFPLRILNDGKITGESSPDYIDNPMVPMRIRELYPDIKLIFLFRDPIDRAFSHYQMTCSFGNGIETLPFEEAIWKEDERLSAIKERLMTEENYFDPRLDYYTYLSKGMYAEQLRNWLQHFKREQMLIIKSEDLFSNPKDIFMETLDFLQLPRYDAIDFKVYNSRSYEKISKATKDMLRSYYAPYNKEFYELSDRIFWDY